MKQVVNWTEWLSRIRQDIDPLEDMGTPARMDADGDRLDADVFLDLLGELERRGKQTETLVAVLSPAQVAGLLVSVNFMERQPAELDEPELPEDMTLYGVPVRVELGFPSDALVMFDPAEVLFDGSAVNPNGVGVVESLRVPNLVDTPLSVEAVRRNLFPELAYQEFYPEGMDEENPFMREADAASLQDADEDPERKGTRFVEDPEDGGDA
jgi:hypothetical protein